MSSSQHQDWVGKKYVDDRAELTSPDAPDARQTNKNEVVRHSELPEGTRVIDPNTMVTMDYNENRWNLYVDEGNKVVKVKRG